MNLTARLAAYFKERFPFKDFVPLSIVIAVTISFGVQGYIFHGLERPRVLLIGSIALFMFLFRLRLFDEFKDFEHDAQYYPDRPVQRGLVTLNELAVLIFIVSGIEFFIAFAHSRLAATLFAGAYIYSLLMFKEFFVSDWLRRHFTAYIASHEILVFPMFFYLFSLNGMPAEYAGKSYFWLLALFLGGQLFLLEVARKVRPKEMEVGSHDTYTAQYGPGGAAALLIFLGAMVAGLYLYAANVIYEKIVMLCLLPLLTGLLFFYSTIKFYRYPNMDNAKGVFCISILYLFIIDAAFAAQFFIR